MSATALTVRAEAPGDAPAVRALHCAAFDTAVEANLVDQLRDDGAIIHSLVAEDAGRVVGHVLYSRLLIDGRDTDATALAPVAVLPERQNRGIGSRLIEEAHRLLEESSEKLVIVLGEPAYYSRFGFSAGAAKRFRTPYDGEYLMALALAPGAPKSGTVTYPAPFARLG